jgi:hypothetical protein
MPNRLTSLFRGQKQSILRLAACPIAAALALALTACNAGAAANSPTGATKKVEIRDPNMNNMVAYTLTIPADWNFQGTVLLNPSCGGTTAVAYRTWSDDLRYGVQRMPEVGWFTTSDGSPYGNCKTTDALNSMQYAGLVLPTLRPKSTLIKVTTAPQANDLANNAKQMQQSRGALAAQYHQPVPTYGYDAKELRIEYNLGSQPEEEFLQVLETFDETPTSKIVSRPGERLRTEATSAKHTTAWIVSERAPKGQLDASRAKLEAIRSSLTVNPQWDYAMGEMIRKRGAQMIADSWKSFNARMKADQNAYNQRFNAQEQNIANMQAQGDKRNADFAAYENSRDRATADKVDAILDRQYYVDPSNGQTSTISTTYTNNWSNGQGDKVLTNIQGYDPNGYVQGNWTQLQPIKH